jgi:hypothetical protein
MTEPLKIRRDATRATTVADEMIEFRDPARGRMPTLVLSERGVDQQVGGQNKRNIHAGLVGKGGTGPTEVSTSDVRFPVYLPTLRQRMDFR